MKYLLKQFYCSTYRLWVSILILLIMVGCGSVSTQGNAGQTQSPSPTYTFVPISIPNPSVTMSAISIKSFPQQKPQQGDQAFPAAEIFGQLTITDGCIRINSRDSTTSYLALWPPNVTFRESAESKQLINDSGEVLAQIGEEVHLGGGEFPESAASSLTDKLQQPLSDQCKGPYWLVSSFL